MKVLLQKLEDRILDNVKQEVVPALGCTEPISLALACAVARFHLGVEPSKIEGKVSANLMKNGMGVTVPGTGTLGLPMAAAIGAIGGDPDGGLEVLKQITALQVEKAKQFLQQDRVRVSIAQCDHLLYSEANLYAGLDSVKVCIEHHHTNIVHIEKNGRVLFHKDSKSAVENSQDFFSQLSSRDVFDFALQVELEKIEFITQAAKLNSALSQEGLRKDYGLHIGRTLQRQIERKLLSDDLLQRIVIETTAASDARMGGAALPAMSNSGSGNQGITATIPVVVVARHLQVEHEKLVRALFFITFDGYFYSQ